LGGSRRAKELVDSQTELGDWPVESTVAYSVWNLRWAAWLTSPRRPPVFVRGECCHSPKALVTDDSRRRPQGVAWFDWLRHLREAVTVG